MDSPGDWTASALFSPSKARAQQAQARDWASVDGWLAKQYGKRLPPFERNEETLQALLSLATLNEDADEQHLLVERVEKTTLQALKKRSPGDTIAYEVLLEAISKGGRDSLHATAESSVLLDQNGVLAVAQSVCQLNAQRFESDQQLERVEYQHAALKREQARLTALLQDLRGEDFQAPSDLPEQTAEWMRNTKQLRAKMAEYDERLSALHSSSRPAQTLEDVTDQTTHNDDERTRLTDLNTELSAFDSLPSDARAAKAKLEVARNELRSLTARRDKLFENLMSGG